MSATALTRDLVVSHTRALKLPGVARTFERLAREARDQGWPHDDYLQEVLSAEIGSRHESVIRQRLREARSAQASWGRVHRTRQGCWPGYCGRLSVIAPRISPTR